MQARHPLSDRIKPMSKQSTVFKVLKLTLAVVRLAAKYPKVTLIILGLAGGSYGYEVTIARPGLLYQGTPQALSLSYDTWFRVLRNHNFILGYSDLRGNPLWVEYALTPVDDTQEPLKRPSHFQTDWRSFNRLSHASYDKSGYDRGHMAPNYAISHLYGKQGQLDSFLMTNITPQHPKLNQKLWQRLEEVEIKQFTQIFSKIWVITGPIFSGSVERLKSDWKVEIPDAFYKIYATEATPDKAPKVLAFLMPQTVNGREPLTQFVTSIDAIEAQTGLDFLTQLDDRIEAPLEAGVDPVPWQLEAVSRLPSRY
jgi:endonuclease G